MIVFFRLQLKENLHGPFAQRDFLSCGYFGYGERLLVKGQSLFLLVNVARTIASGKGRFF